jgi:hypothetical protein
MSGAIGFDGPAGQQQAQYDAKDHLLLPGQPIHKANLMISEPKSQT